MRAESNTRMDEDAPATSADRRPAVSQMQSEIDADPFVLLETGPTSFADALSTEIGLLECGG